MGAPRTGQGGGRHPPGRDRGRPISAATVEALQAIAAAGAGDLPGFRSATARHSARLRERGLEWLEATHAATLGVLLAQLDEPDEGARLLQTSYDILLRTGDIWWAGVVEPTLALCLDLADRNEQFLAVIDRGPISGMPDDQVTALMWSIVRARADRRRGRLGEAVTAAGDAVAQCAERDAAMISALAHESLAGILDEAGEAAEAAVARAAALGTYTQGSFAPGISRLKSGRPPPLHAQP